MHVLSQSWRPIDQSSVYLGRKYAFKGEISENSTQVPL